MAARARTALLRLGLRRGLVFAAFAGAYYFSNFFRSANGVISADLRSQLSLSAAQLGLMTSLFYALFALVQLPLGAALDRWGPRWATSGLMVLAVVGALVFSRGRSFPVLALGRALMGAGMAGALMGTYKAFSRWFSPERFATACSMVVAVGAVGALSTGTPLAWFDQAFGWRAIFVWGAVGVGISALSVALLVRNRPAGVVAKREAAEPGRLRDVFRSRAFWPTAVLNCMVVGTFLSFQGLWGGAFAFDVLRTSQVGTGNLITLAGLGSLVGYLTCGWLADRYGRQRVALSGASVFLIAQLLLVVTGITGTRGIAYPAFLLFGFGGAYNIILMAYAREIFPINLTGRAVTAVNMFGVGGAGVMQWLMGVLVGSFGRDAAGHYPAEAYVVTFALTGVACLLALLWFGRLRLTTTTLAARTSSQTVDVVGFE